MGIKELVIAIVVAHVIVEVAKFVGEFAFYMVYIMVCETNEEFCKHHLDSYSMGMKYFAQKVYKRKWEPNEKLREEMEKVIVGFNRFTIDG